MIFETAFFGMFVGAYFTIWAADDMKEDCDAQAAKLPRNVPDQRAADQKTINGLMYVEGNNEFHSMPNSL